jgi:hypothetical protein
MIGTEKQIAWAEQIKNTVTPDDFKNALSKFVGKKFFGRDWASNSEEFEKIIETVFSEASAKWWINNRKNISNMKNGNSAILLSIARNFSTKFNEQ